ncbi:MAG: hypothetical protein GWP91_05250 [Rhodobacterales bacterium]|nr:hypothetical protein [Rhodobacterales bacterium]
MGGLGGLIHFGGSVPDADVIGAMSHRLRNRGPAVEERWAEGGCRLVHRIRRANSSQTRQPAVTEDVVVMLDGWVYDHEALAASADDGPPSESDVEALVRAWRAWGPDFIDRVEGEFAIVVWDRKERRCHIFRDRMGVRPLFWSRRGDKFAFASELRSLLCVPWVTPQINPDNLAEYLSFQVVHAPRTLLWDVHQVAPAHRLEVDQQGERSHPWWRLKYARVGTPVPPPGEVIEAIEAAVAAAVRRRVPRGVETGLYLSGGLGSTAIAQAAHAQYLRLPSFTVSFADDLYPELPFAGRVAGLMGLEHVQVEVGTAAIAASFLETVQALGHPVGHPAAVLQMALARSAAERVRVALSGDGAEELFGGRMLLQIQRGLRFNRVLDWMPRPVGGVLSRAMGGRGHGQSGRDWVLEQGIGGANLFSTEERARLFRDPGHVRPAVRQEVLGAFYAELETDAVNTALHGYLRSRLTESDLVRADRTAAAAGLDLRFPLLDRAVVECAAMIPGSTKIPRTGGSLHTRWPLRAMLQGTLPTALLDRPKRGLPKPLDHWLAGPGRLFMEERFAKLREDRLGLWRKDGLDQVRRDLTRNAGAGVRLWTLFWLDAWAESLVE